MKMWRKKQTKLCTKILAIFFSMDKTETGSEIYSFFLFNHSIIWWYQWKRKKNYRIQIQEMYSYNLHTDTHTHILGYWCHICYTWCGYYGDAKMLIFLLCYVMLFFSSCCSIFESLGMMMMMMMTPSISVLTDWADWI